MPGDTTPVGDPEAITSYEEVEVAVLGEPMTASQLDSIMQIVDDDGSYTRGDDALSDTLSSCELPSSFV